MSPEVVSIQSMALGNIIEFFLGSDCCGIDICANDTATESTLKVDHSTLAVSLSKTLTTVLLLVDYMALVVGVSWAAWVRLVYDTVSEGDLIS